eukprot:m.469495 g.469495  ORF g.469495 m.469495 type:complete len:230 (-) comp28598_c0_seq1:250-939(-)
MDQEAATCSASTPMSVADGVLAQVTQKMHMQQSVQKTCAILDAVLQQTGQLTGFQQMRSVDWSPESPNPGAAMETLAGFRKRAVAVTISQRQCATLNQWRNVLAMSAQGALRQSKRRLSSAHEGIRPKLHAPDMIVCSVTIASVTGKHQAEENLHILTRRRGRTVSLNITAALKVVDLANNPQWHYTVTADSSPVGLTDALQKYIRLAPETILQYITMELWPQLDGHGG